MLPRVLVVDDDLEHLRTFERAFRHDFRVVVACSGVQALEMLKEEPVDVVVSDYSMPGMNGLALLRQVRRGWPRTGRVLVSARPEMEYLRDAQEEGVVHAIVGKPWDALVIRDLAWELHHVDFTRRVPAVENVWERPSTAALERPPLPPATVSGERPAVPVGALHVTSRFERTG